MSSTNIAACGSALRIMLSALAVACFVFALPADTGAAVITSGGTQTGVKVCKEFTERNNSGKTATDLHFKAWQKEDDRHINGWEISISCCDAATSQRSTQPGSHNDGSTTHAVDVSTSPGDCTVPPGGICKIRVCFWLTRSNAIRMADFKWTFDAAPEEKAEPDNGFWIGCPTDGGIGGDIFGSGNWRHSLIIGNDDDSRSIRILDLGIQISPVDIDSLINDVVTTPGPNLNILLGPGDTYRLDILTPDESIGEYIYAKYSLRGLDLDSVYAAAVALQHEIEDCPPPQVPSLTGWGFILFGALILSTGAYYIWRRRRLSHA